MHRVRRHETDPAAAFRSPITELALVGLAATKDRENVFELCGHLLFRQTKVGFISENKTAEGGAGDLLAATVRIFFQVGIESVGEAEGQGRDRGCELPEFRI